MSVRIIIHGVLLKISKHLALLACLLILGRSSGQYEVGPLWLFGLVGTSALLHLVGRRLSHFPAFSMQPRRRIR